MNANPLFPKLLAVAVTIMVVGVGTVFLRQDANESSEPAITPAAEGSVLEQVITKMLTAAQSGNIEAYLDCFQGELRETLARRLDAIPQKTAATELRNTEKDLKNFVTTDTRTPADDEMILVLERSYSDFRKRHRVRLKRSNGNWAIVELTPLDRYAPKIPYGTPVFTPVEDSGSDEK